MRESCRGRISSCRAGSGGQDCVTCRHLILRLDLPFCSVYLYMCISPPGKVLIVEPRGALSVNPSGALVRIADSAPIGNFRRPPRARTWVPEGVRGIPVTASARSTIVPAIFRSGFAVGAVWRPWQAAREAWQRVDSSTDAARSAQPATPGIKSVRRVH